MINNLVHEVKYEWPIPDRSVRHTHICMCVTHIICICIYIAATAVINDAQKSSCGNIPTAIVLFIIIIIHLRGALEPRGLPNNKTYVYGMYADRLRLWMCDAICAPTPLQSNQIRKKPKLITSFSLSEFSANFYESQPAPPWSLGADHFLMSFGYASTY